MAKDLPPLVIHLDLGEFLELNTVVEHASSGLIARGDVFNKDPGRDGKILKVVEQFFQPLAGSLTIKLGDGTGSDRFLKATFAWGNNPEIGGMSAQGLTRSKLGKFSRRAADTGKPVTGYVFEGVIGNWIMDYLGSKPVNVDNIFGTVIAHELGHQLGLDHEKASDNVMFVFTEESRAS
jgi:Matrixin